MKIKAIIFDLNGVFIKGPYLSNRFKNVFNVPNEVFLPVMKKIMERARKPKAGDIFEYWKPYLKKWGVNLNKSQFLDFWFKPEKPTLELIKTAKELKKKGLKLFILSNNLKERTDYYNKNFSFLNELFEKVYYSWQTGYVKPNPKALKNLLKENNLKTEECVYFDDQEKNIEEANKLGVKSFLFKGAGSLTKAVKAIK